MENANFDFAAFLAIFVTCNFAQTFSIDSTHWHGGRVKILQMRNSCNLIKLGCKDFHFFFQFQFSQTVWNIGVLSVPVYIDRGSQNWFTEFAAYREENKANFPLPLDV